jgi:mannose-6-phosphate isomerase-like protein (cupin superfamily)
MLNCLSLLSVGPLVMGVGCSLFCSILSSQFRITERLWLCWLYLTNLDESRDLKPYNRPSPALDATEVIQKSEHGESKLLLSPNTAATSSLHVSVVSLKPNTEIPSRHARGVEFYYVLSGSGAFSQQGVVETSKITKGDCFVVDHGNMRWINTKDQNEDLHLLRATDGGSRYSSPTLDLVRRDPSRSAGVGEMVNRFVRTLWSSDRLSRNETK